VAKPEELNSESFTHRIREVIAHWPLYRTLEFTGSVLVRTPQPPKALPLPIGTAPTMCVAFPFEIEMDCATCSMFLRWEVDGVRHATDFGGSYFKLRYVCRNCSAEMTEVFLRLQIKDAGGRVAKVGQYPPLERQPVAAVASSLDEDDLKLYRQALTLRNHNLGIAAVAYLRRIIENNTNAVLDLIAHHAATVEGNSPLLKKLDEMKHEKQFSTKIEYAAELLPASLKPGGHNPLSVLHGLASAGLHGESDEECIDIFDHCQASFEHVITKLKEDLEKDQDYLSVVNKLNEKAAKVKEKAN
jgi:hypothetical protein